jgi:hypothetical protein
VRFTSVFVTVLPTQILLGVVTAAVFLHLGEARHEPCCVG